MTGQFATKSYKVPFLESDSYLMVLLVFDPHLSGTAYIHTAGLLIAVLQLAENMSTDSMPIAY